MCKLKLVTSLAVLAAGLSAIAGDVLPQTNGRIWQTVFDETAPIEWRWKKHAVKADFIVTNLLTKTDSTTAVTRTDGAATGSVAMPNPTRSADTGEGLVDAVLVQYDANDAVISSQLARLAFLPNAITVETGRARFGRARAPRVVSYDSLWNTETVNAVTAKLVLTGTSATEVDLPTVGGYFPLAAGDRTVQVKFDGAAQAALEAAVYTPRGLVISFK